MSVRGFKRWRLAVRGGVVGLLLVLGLMVGGQHVSANPLPIVYVSGPITNNQTWSVGSVYMILGSVTVPDGVTLTITEGTIVKVGSTGTGINVSQGGTVNVVGSDNDPVIFTSYRDDSAGGDSDGGGVSTGYLHDYITAIRVDGGSANVSKGAFQFGYASVEGSCIGHTSPALS